MSSRACAFDMKRDRSDHPVASLRALALPVRLAGSVLLVATLSSGCRQQEAPVPEMPPPSVVAVPAVSRVVEEEGSFIGRVAAVDRVDLRARVEGFLEERRFNEGQEVAVGDILFLIEPDQYEATVQQRQADLEKAQADQLNTSAQLARGRELLKAKNISQSDVDAMQAADSMAKASIAQAQAALNQAHLNLSYTTIRSPVAGRIGLSIYTVGNLVDASSGTLATIVSRDPIYVQFPVTQRDLLEARQTIEDKGGNAREVTVRVRLPNGALYEHAGRLDFVDVTTDPGTDSVTLRASLPNPEGILVDRQYVGVLLESGAPESAILIPQSALQVDQQGSFVFIIDAQSKAQVRRIETGQSKGSDVVVKKGVADGDLVITQGIQQVKPGQVVRAAPAAAAVGGDGA